jgi:D-serine deaminase-like pyridoxal phosphate-dependent protein
MCGKARQNRLGKTAYAKSRRPGIDAGWMAMSRDRGTQKQKRDFGYVEIEAVALA